MKKERFSILLVTLVLFIVLRSLIHEHLFTQLVLGIMMLAFFMATLFAVSEEKKFFIAAVILCCFEFLAFVGQQTLIEVPHVRSTCDILLPSLNIPYCLLLALIILMYVFKGSHVTRDKIAAALCVYFLLGISWSSAYELVEVVDHGALISSSEPLVDDETGDYPEEAKEDITYFSFVTLTTLGYGDITPRSRVARTLAYLEAIVGQLYLAVLIARLVGLHAASAREMKSVAD